MRALLTADQFRWVWRLAGGDAIPMPLQAPGRGRMVSDRDRIDRETGEWWAADEDPDLYAAVRTLRQSAAWLHVGGFPAGGEPLRALLGVGGSGAAVLAVQAGMRAVLDADSRDWYPDTAIDGAGWSLERGGDIRIVQGHAATLLEELLAGVPPFRAGAAPAMRAELSAAVAGGSHGDYPHGDYTSRATTTSRGERIAALLARPRAQHGFVYSSVADGVGSREVGRLGWIEVAGDGGYLVAQDGAVSVRPAGHGDPAAPSELAAAARQLLASAESAPSVV